MFFNAQITTFHHPEFRYDHQHIKYRMFDTPTFHQPTSAQQRPQSLCWGQCTTCCQYSRKCWLLTGYRNIDRYQHSNSSAIPNSLFKPSICHHQPTQVVRFHLWCCSHGLVFFLNIHPPPTPPSNNPHNPNYQMDHANSNNGRWKQDPIERKSPPAPYHQMHMLH